MIDALAALYGCTILLCTATQPAFDSAQLQDGGLDLTGRELAPDPPALARQLRRARIVPGDVMTDDDLVAGLRAAHDLTADMLMKNKLGKVHAQIGLKRRRQFGNVTSQFRIVPTDSVAWYGEGEA